MKRTLVVLTMVLIVMPFIITIVFFNQTNKAIMEWRPSIESIAQASVIGYADLVSLQKEAEHIAIVEPINEFADEIGLFREETFGTKRSVRVKKIIKGEIPDKIINVGEDAAIYEPEKKGEKILYRFENYFPMEKGKKYMLFLRSTETEENGTVYGIVGVYQGKFNIDETDQREKVLNNLDFHREIFNDIKNTYKNEINESLK